ncbi:P2Y purinoceptor 1-like [Ambystoma mexicanum]|uniref:P2Y purinoceptor 1-like n=1 Tax=Ambystoma mexicanum TaxID=8296 RepID=UPI0037E7F6B9
MDAKEPTDLSSIPPDSNYSLANCQVNRDFTYRYLPAVYMTVCLAGILGNGLGLWNLCVNWKKWNNLNILVCNLGVADLLYVITLPFLASYYINGGKWTFGLGFCRVTRCLFNANLYASIGFLTCISIQRYLGIVHPMKMIGRFSTKRCSLLVSAAVWVWVLVQIVPDLLFTKTNENATHCYDSTSNESLGKYLPYSMTIMVTGFVIPFVIIIGCYSHILVVLARNQNVDPILKRRSIKLVVIVMVLFSVCFFPYHLFRNLNLLARGWQLRGTCTQTLRNIYLSYQLTRGLACMNSAINPLVYLVTNENFVMMFRTLSRRAWESFSDIKAGRMQRLSDRKKLNIIACEEQYGDSGFL